MWARFALGERADHCGREKPTCPATPCHRRDLAIRDHPVQGADADAQAAGHLDAVDVCLGLLLIVDDPHAASRSWSSIWARTSAGSDRCLAAVESRSQSEMSLPFRALSA